MKRFSLSSLVAAFLLGVLLASPAAAIAKDAPATWHGLPTVKLVVNGVAMDSAKPPVLIDGSTYVPIRMVAESLGSEVAWDAETATVSVEGGVAPEGTVATTATVPVVGSPESEGTPARIALEEALTAAKEIYDAAIAAANAEKDAAYALLAIPDPTRGSYEEAAAAITATWVEQCRVANVIYQAAVAAANAAYATP